MQTLFGKIFLWFFCAQVLIGAVMFGIGVSQRDATTPQPVREMMNDELRWQSASAVLLARGGQLEKLALELATGRARSTIYWLPRGGNLRIVAENNPKPTSRDTSGRDTSGRDTSGRDAAMRDAGISDADLRKLAARAVQNTGVQWLPNEQMWVAALARPTDVGTVVVVRRIARRSRSVFDFFKDWRSPDGRVRGVVLMALMALVCYGLARHFTAPVAQLRDATKRLASGDLSARVAFGERGGDELMALGRDFDAMATRLEAGVEAERQLLGDISHELRSPLARLSVALDLVEQGRARAQSRSENLPEGAYLAALERVRRESGRLNELIGQLLELTRLETLAGEGGLGQIVELNEIVAEIVEDAQFEARSRSCKVQLLKNEHCSLRGVPSLLHSAVENVVRNAVRYTAPETSVEVTLCCEQLENCDFALLRVRDFGVGVPDEALELLFRPFYRVASSRERQSGGVGLGLSIAQRALRVHGATIQASNAPGGGLQVEIRLPLESHHRDWRADQHATASIEKI